MSQDKLSKYESILRTPATVGERSARAVKLKNELNTMLELVVNIRERLVNEIDDAKQMKFIDKGFMSKLKDLAQIFDRLTSARIQLDKAERALEAEMTPYQELQAVRSFIREMKGSERAEFLRNEILWHKAQTGRDTGKLVLDE